MRKFNTTGGCNPSDHYMVDISERLKEIKTLIDEGNYFCINRARQYGKTTTLDALVNYLKDDYLVISLDFQDMDSDVYTNGGTFTQGLARLLIYTNEFSNIAIPDKYVEELNRMIRTRVDELNMDELFFLLRRWCKESERKIVLMIDEVDTASNNQVFLDFLAQLRSGYLKRKTIPAFQSVILAGVTDVKHLKAKIRPDETHKENSPWNTREGNEKNESLLSFGDCPRDHMAMPYDIAADFNIDMSLSETGIKGMLEEYDADHQIGMDTEAIARLIREYTNGYPFLVSRICQLIDGDISKTMPAEDAWTRQGVEAAVKMILAENNTLFQSLTKNLNAFPEMKASIRSILMEGTKLAWNAQQDAIVQMQMYGLIRNDHNTVRIANRIFETLLYNLFLSDEELKNNVFSRAGELAGNSSFCISSRSSMVPGTIILKHRRETRPVLM